MEFIFISYAIGFFVICLLAWFVGMVFSGIKAYLKGEDWRKAIKPWLSEL